MRWRARCGGRRSVRASPNNSPLPPRTTISPIGRRTDAGSSIAPIATTRWSCGFWIYRAVHARPLTKNGAVNVEPRFSPDGKRIVFTSTLYNKRFHLFTADFARGRACEHPALDGRAQERGAALLLQPVRSRDQSGLDPRRARNSLRIQSQPHLRHRRILAHVGESSQRRQRRGAAAPPLPTRRNFITRKRIGRRVPMSRPTARGWCTAPTSGVPGTIYG